MGVEPDHHRRGIGRALCEAAIASCRKDGVRYLFVATLHPDDPYEPFQRTRRFYEAIGFSYVLKEQFPADPANPTAYYLKPL
jgi:GNAT superfamily N-acetyltransferase